MGVSMLGYILRPAQLRPGWLVLYAVTFAIELFSASVRSFIAYAVLWVAFSLVGQPTGPVHDLAILAGYGPLALSAAALVLPLGGWWWQQQAGGRSPSSRERLLLDDAISELRAVDPGLRGPHRWFVLDTGSVNGAVYADTLMLTRGLLESPWLAAVLAHELGHMHSSDGRLTAAIHRLTTTPRRELRWDRPGRRLLRALTFVATGELALWFTRGLWGVYWRAREHHADRYAADLGQAEALAEFLDVSALPWDLPVPFV